MNEAFEQELIAKYNYLNRTIARSSIYEAQRLLQVQTREIARDAVVGTSGRVQASLQAFADSLNTNAGRNRSGRMRSLHQDVALAAQDAVLVVYDERFGKGLPYRQNDVGKWQRYSGGRMRRALASGNLFRARADGIDMNVGFLDDQAAQWYRLNFGALPKGSSSPAPPAVTMRFFGSQTIGGASLRGFGPSKPFSIPAGVFSASAFPTTSGQNIQSVPRGSGQGQPFYPVGAGLQNYNRRPKQYRLNREIASGIIGGRFLDAGVNKINEVLPVAMEQLITEWTEEAAGATFNKSGSLRSAGGSGPLATAFTEQQAQQLMATQANAIRKWDTRARADLRTQLARNRRIFSS